MIKLSDPHHSQFLTISETNYATPYTYKIILKDSNSSIKISSHTPERKLNKYAKEQA